MSAPARGCQDPRLLLNLLLVEVVRCSDWKAHVARLRDLQARYPDSAGYGELADCLERAAGEVSQ